MSPPSLHLSYGKSTDQKTSICSQNTQNFIVNISNLRHHWFNGYEFEQTLGDSEGQGSLACCSPWGLQKVGHDWATEQQKALLPFWSKNAVISAREDLAQIWFPSCWDFKSELPQRNHFKRNNEDFLAAEWLQLLLPMQWIPVWSLVRELRSHMLCSQKKKLGSSWWRSGKEFSCQCRRHGFNPWSERIPDAVEQLSP